MALPDPLIGKKLGDYKIESLLGKGGMARVYKGLDENLDRYAAVKVITSEFAATIDEVEYTERFQREARAIAKLRHPHIVNIYQFGQTEGLYYMAMVFLDGEDLRFALRNTALKSKRMPISEILQMAAEIADALDYAHKSGVIHRDIKPSNIMMTSRGAVLTDFGLALSTAEGTMGDTFGSAHYIAPEQAVSSARAVPQSDLYSLGIVLYESLAGKVPFDDPSAMSVALKHLNEPPPPLRTFNPDLPKSLEDVIMKVLNKEPKLRHQTGRELVDALYNAVDEKPVVIATRVPERNISIDKRDTATPGKLLKTATQSMKAAESEESDPSANSPLDAYLQSLRDGSHLKRPSIAKNILSDIIKERTSPKPLDVEATDTAIPIEKKSNPPSKSVLSDIGTTKPEAPDKSKLGGSKPKKVFQEEESHSKLPLIFLVGIILLALGGGAYLILSSGDGDKDKGTSTNAVAESETQTAVAIAALPTDTETSEPATATEASTATDVPTATDAPTETETPEPATATDEPTETDLPTVTKTAISSPSPTLAPTENATNEASTEVVANPTLALVTVTPNPSATTEGPEIKLLYDENQITLTNISGRRQNISGLIFEGDVEGRFDAFDWFDAPTVENGIFSFRADGCVQVAIDTTLVKPMSCRFYNTWLIRGLRQDHFWRSEAGNSTFIVRKGEIFVAECDISAGECEFSLP